MHATVAAPPSLDSLEDLVNVAIVLIVALVGALSQLRKSRKAPPTKTPDAARGPAPPERRAADAPASVDEAALGPAELERAMQPAPGAALPPVPAPVGLPDDARVPRTVGPTGREFPLPPVPADVLEVELEDESADALPAEQPAALPEPRSRRTHGPPARARPVRLPSPVPPRVEYPTAAPESSESAAVAQAGPAPAPTSSGGFDVQRVSVVAAGARRAQAPASADVPRSVPVAASPVGGPALIRELLARRDGQRAAFVLAEILGPPLGLRRRDPTAAE